MSETVTKPCVPSSRVRGVSHIAIGVSDMERSLGFYRDVLGLEVSVDRVEVSTVPTPKNRRACYLRWTTGAGSSYVVLDQHLDRPPMGVPAALFELGVHHVSFLTDDIEEVIARSKAAGIEVWGEGRPGVRDGFANGEPEGEHVVKTILMRDPDGTIIQFDEWLGEEGT